MTPRQRAETAKERAMEERVREVLNKVRRGLQADGGDADLVEVTADGVVKVRLRGACKGCPMSQMTLKRGIEAAIKAEVPEVVRVEAVD
jgi:Fe-S cluster biogenesis protein NfuA